MLIVTLPDGRKLELMRPPEWDAAVVDACIDAWRIVGTTVAANVRPLKPGFKVPIQSRSHPAGWGFWSATDGRFERWGDPKWSALVPTSTGDLLVCRYYEHRIQRLSWPD